MPAERDARADAERLDRVFSALAHGERRGIIAVIAARGGSMTAGEIADRFACAWPTVTRHLGVLVAAGLVEVERRGRHRIYRLGLARAVALIHAWLDNVAPKRRKT